MIRSVTAAIAGAMVLVGMVAAPASAATPGPAPALEAVTEVGDPTAALIETSGQPTGLWVVQLADPALASYTGGVRDLQPTSPRVTGQRELDVSAPASAAYLTHLEQRQQEAVRGINRALGRTVDVAHRYRNVVNGLAVRVSEDEAALLAELPGVAAVHRDVTRAPQTDVSHELIGSGAVWDGATGSGVATRGEGVIVGVIDTGINPDHPSFAATDGEGYSHTNPFGSGSYVGVCDPEHPEHEDICNDKLIGAWNIHPFSPSARDADGHGSHTASTAAGNRHEATVPIGNGQFTRTLQGVAPRANIISYLVCFPTCPLTSSVAAVNQAIEDGVDVLNYSIGGSDSPWTDIVDLAFLDAYNAGIFVAASAGNDGPGASTVAKTGPWNAAVAATSHSRVFANPLTVDHPGPLPPALAEVWAAPGTGPQLDGPLAGTVRDAGQVDPGNLLGCQAFPAGAFAGEVALIGRGACDFSDKVDNAAAAGAVAVVVANSTAGPPIPMGALEETGIPAFMIDLAGGSALRDLVTESDVDVTIQVADTTELVVDPAWEDIVAGFSSRGPSQFNLLAPTFAAPGVNILAAGAGAADRYEVMQGTSMASPHAAGAGALLTALHPDWSPAEIRSALAGTAVPEGLYKEDGVTAAEPFDVGSGRMDLARAGRVGIVLDESHANFVAANPADGGDPRQLNLPAMVDRDCAGDCTWTRLLTSTAGATASYTAQVDAPDGVSVTVTPEEFTLAAGATGQVEIAVEVDVSAVPAGEWAYGAVTFTTDDAHPDGTAIAPVSYPVAIVPMPAVPQRPEITVAPDEVSDTLQPGESAAHTVTIGNSGNADLSWHVFENEPLQQPRAVSAPVPAAEAPSTAGRGAAGLATDARTADQPVTVTAPEAPSPASDLSRTITHSASQAVVSANSIACSSDQGVTTTGNAYLRAYRLADFEIADRFDVVEVEFGVETLTRPTELTVNLYTMTEPGGALEYANLAEIGSASRIVAGQSLSHIAVPVTGHAPAGSTLVVEIEAPDLSGEGAFFPGSNGAGQSAPGYLRSEACGMPEPVNLAALGAPGMHLVMNVTGLTEAPTCDLPGAVDWARLAPTSGTVAPDDQQLIELTLDASGASPGDYQGNLCLASDDPRRPLLAVPVELTVVEPPELDLEVEVWFHRGEYFAHLTWDGVESDTVEVYRDEEQVATVPAAGTFTDELGRPRARVTEYDYQVCQAGGEFCSPVQTAVVDRMGAPPRPPWHPGPRPSLQITTEQLPDLHVLELYEANLTAGGGSGVHLWAATGLPDGLELHPGTGLITNDPYEPAVIDGGTAEVTVTVVDASDPTLSASTTFELTVTGIAQLASGWGHTCAVTTEQTAYCWGRNATGQIGNGVVGGDGVHEPLPTQVRNSDDTGPLTGVTKIAGGDGHTCALTTDQTVYCWGASFDGRLGYGDPTIEPQPLPMQVRNGDDTGPLTGVVDITTGSQFGCAVTEAGSAYCWGNNHSGKLGNGNVGGIEPLPVAVRDTDGTGVLSGVTGITGGGSHGCAWQVDAAYCWGNNFQGQLGNGETSTPVPHPVQVRDDSGDSTLSGVAQMSAAAGHTCAATEAGAAYCWGRNSSGQVGDGTEGGDQPLPVRVRDSSGDGTLDGVVQVASGDNHTCAVGSGEQAYCWGSNFFAQLGNSDVDGEDTSALPVAVHDRHGTGPLSGVATVAAGSGHSCVLTGTGTARCWGTNFNRQLGIGDTSDQHRQVLPAPVYPSGWAGPPLTIDTDALPTLHVLESYEATLRASHGEPPYQWSATGLPDGLVLDPGTGTITNHPDDPAITELPGSLTVTVTDAAGATAHAVLPLESVGIAQLTAGDNHACAVTTEATAYCWGANTSGQLGDGGFADRSLPAPVIDPDSPQQPLAGVASMTAGAAHTCAAMTDGSAYCWGFNGAGRLGLGHENPLELSSPAQVVGPGGVDHLADVTAVTAGGLHTCALVESGTAYCWGDNFRGQLGSPGQVGGTPTRVIDPDGGPDPLAGLTAIGAGGFHTCAVTEAGTGYCWGWNHVGQLGIGETFPAMSSTPLPVIDPQAPELHLTGLAHISGGGVHTCAGTTTGVAYCWGQNAHGQVGNGAAPANTPAPAPVVDPADPQQPLTGLVSAGPGTIHSCAVTEDATAYCWGNNSEGQLGDGSTESTDVPFAVVDPTDPDRPFSGVAQLVHKGWFTCAATTGGTAYCWGHNGRGQLGDGSVDNRHAPTPVRPGA